MLNASDFEAKSIKLMHPMICGSCYCCVAALHIAPVVLAATPGAKRRIHDIPNANSSRKNSLAYLGIFDTIKNERAYVLRAVVRVIRMVSQTWIAYDMADRLALQSVSFAYSIVFVCSTLLTCWTVLVDFTSDQEILVRFVKSFLAFLLSSGFPLCFAVVPLVHYKFFSSGNEVHNYKWLAQILSSTRYIAISSIFQILFNIGLSALSFISLQSVAKELHHMHFQRQLTLVNPVSVEVSTVQPNSKIGASNSSIQNSSLGSFRLNRQYLCQRRLIVAAEVVWAVCVLILATTAYLFNESCPSECIYDTRPWLRPKCNCIYLKVDCKPSEDTVENLLNPIILGSSLLLLHTRHCPLENGIPASALKPFDSLYAIQLEFTKMMDWNISSSDIPPSVMVIQIRYSNLTQIPLALHNPSDHWTTLHIIGSPVGNIPPNVSKAWINLHSLWLKHANMTEFPPGIQNYKYLDTLGLSGNSISSIPDGMETLSSLNTVYLDGNLIDKIPSAWLQAKPSLKLYLNNNPIKRIADTEQKLLSPLVDLSSTPYCVDNAIISSDVCQVDCSVPCSRPHLGNEFCDISCNTSQCGYDNGDCADE